MKTKVIAIISLFLLSIIAILLHYFLSTVITFDLFFLLPFSVLTLFASIILVFAFGVGMAIDYFKSK
ncbi:MAG: hypothetical protein K9L74_06880 [Candidatus Izimaplasma sp.]|nr:hypothetical protein [Candidatus Izimaplasma bacterium]